MTDREVKIRRLYQDRPRSRFVHLSVLILLGLMIGSWWVGNFDPANQFTQRRMDNLARFLGELKPYPLQGREFEPEIAFEWIADRLADKGWSAVVTTLAISVAAIVLASLAGAFLSLPAARNFASPQPFSAVPPAGFGAVVVIWLTLVTVSRAVLVFARAIPEYVWAFLFLAVLGPTAWPAVLALALHNTGILGKLGAEIVENTERAPLAALQGLGGNRFQIALAGLLPMAFSRFLLFFFYRWETCVREATVLGLLGIVSLGYWIQDARARNFYDETLFFILLGSLLVLIGDVISALARELVRRA